jgi:SAM-dependent methyltransferase
MSPERTRPDPSVHWDDVYTRLTDTEVSWYEASPESSLALLDAAGATPEMTVVDIGAGASRLVDALLARGFSDVTALDVSDGGLARSRERLGPDAGRVRWEVADLLGWQPHRRFGVWHDRAVFHFLVDPGDRARYRSLLSAALEPGAIAVIAAFAPDGPQMCSGLPTERYSPSELADTIGEEFDVVSSRLANHLTPAGVLQPFTWVALRRPT